MDGAADDGEATVWSEGDAIDLKIGEQRFSDESKSLSAARKRPNHGA